MDSNDQQRAAARALADRAHEVGHAPDGTPWQRALRWISRGRLGRPRASWNTTTLNTPWQDTPSPERTGWRERAANLADDTAFAVDYLVCPRCRLGWVEWPYTPPQYQRCGLASAGFAALRAEHPGLSWHTLGSHGRDSRAFWQAVGEGVPGGYQQRDTCPHLDDV